MYQYVEMNHDKFIFGFVFIPSSVYSECQFCIPWITLHANSSSDDYHDGQITLSTLFIKPNIRFQSPQTQYHNFSVETNPLTAKFSFSV